MNKQTAIAAATHGAKVMCHGHRFTVKRLEGDRFFMVGDDGKEIDHTWVCCQLSEDWQHIEVETQMCPGVTKAAEAGMVLRHLLPKLKIDQEGYAAKCSEFGLHGEMLLIAIDSASKIDSIRDDEEREVARMAVEGMLAMDGSGDLYAMYRACRAESAGHDVRLAGAFADPDGESDAGKFKVAVLIFDEHGPSKLVFLPVFMFTIEPQEVH